MRYRSRFNAVGGIADFWSEWKKPTPHRWWVLGAALLVTGTLFSWLAKEQYYYPPEQPKVTYITTFADGRTDAEIRASNLENQRRKDAREAEIAKRLERRRELYKEMGAATGLDVEEMEARILEQEKAEAAAEKERLEGLFADRQAEGSQDDSE